MELYEMNARFTIILTDEEEQKLKAYLESQNIKYILQDADEEN